MSEEFKVVLTTDAIEYLAAVSEWIKTAPKSDEHDEFWVGSVAIEWGHSDKPIATFRAEDDYYLVEVTNG